MVLSCEIFCVHSTNSSKLFSDSRKHYVEAQPEFKHRQVAHDSRKITLVSTAPYTLGDCHA